MTGKELPATAETLIGIDLFRGLDAEQREALSHYCRLHRYQAGEIVLAQDDPSRDVFFIVSGTVGVKQYSPAGKEVALRQQGAGETFGELSAIDESPRSASVEAITECLIVSMAPSQFWEVLHAFPTVNQTLLRRLTQLVRLLSDRVFESSTLPVKSRIHAWILRRSLESSDGENEVTLKPFPKHQQLANELSTHREAITRELADLANMGIVERGSGQLVVKDVSALQELLDKARGR
ncbi:MAG: Crp/Fnr family transcriptional regulator [Pseudomonadota bacterium]